MVRMWTFTEQHISINWDGASTRFCIAVLIFVTAILGSAQFCYSENGKHEGSIVPSENPTLPRNKTLNSSVRESRIQILQDSHPEWEKAVDHNGNLAGKERIGTIEERHYDILRNQDTTLKRKARLQGIRMRALYGPEVAYQGGFINAEDEVGSRHTIAATMPLTEIWELAAFDNLSFFSLKNESSSASRESMTLRFGMNPGRKFRSWFALTPYFNFGDADGTGLGVTAGMSNTWRNGANLAAEMYAWRPWDEGYYTIIEDGRKHGGTLWFTLPFTKDLILSSRAFYEELDLGDGAKSGAQYAGNRYGINARAYYRLLHRDNAFMGYGFRDDNLYNEYLVGSELGIFMQLDFQRYFRPDGFDALNPVPEVFAQEIGASFQYAISPHIGLVAEGFLGRDPDRDLGFGELAGINGRLIVVVNPHLQIWTGASYLKTNTTLESSGGEETILSFGINYTF